MHYSLNITYCGSGCTMKLSAVIKKIVLLLLLLDLCMMQCKPVISAKPAAVFCRMNMDPQAQELKLCTYSPVGGFTVTVAFTL